MTEPRIAIVTGAGGEIGRAIAASLRDKNRIVIACDIDGVSAAATADALDGPAGRVLALEADVTAPESVSAIAEEARRHGLIDILINNAGRAEALSLGTSTTETFRADLAINLEAAHLCFQTFVSDLKSTSGAVVNIASVNGMGAYGHPGYSAAKAGLIHLTRMIAVEYGKFGIRCNAVAPGTVRTRAWDDRAESNPAIFDEVARWYPLGRIARTGDVAAAVAFLASPAAHAITGICLPVDCGLTAGQTDLARAFSQSQDY